MNLFLFPHPDDEFGVAQPLADLRARGQPVSCAYLTDGGHGGQPTDVRRDESLRVLARLGVPPADVHFLGAAGGFEDGRLHTRLDPALAALRTLCATLPPLACVAFPAWEGGHQDHDATHLLGLALARGAGAQALQFPLYHGAGLPGPLFRVMAPLRANGPGLGRRATARERIAQMRRCLSYPSQWRSWIGLWPGVAWRMLVDGRFHLQAATPERVRQRPHAGALLFERRGFATARDFAAHAGPFIDTHLPR